MADAARIIGRDVAMTANIMKLVNSAFFGARRTITSVDRAVAYLGLDTLGALVLGHSLFQERRRELIEGFSWSDCGNTACGPRSPREPSRAMEELRRTESRGGLSSRDILHDVGKVVFATRGRPGR